MEEDGSDDELMRELLALAADEEEQQQPPVGDHSSDLDTLLDKDLRFLEEGAPDSVDTHIPQESPQQHLGATRSRSSSASSVSPEQEDLLQSLLFELEELSGQPNPSRQSQDVGSEGSLDCDELETLLQSEGGTSPSHYTPGSSDGGWETPLSSNAVGPDIDALLKQLQECGELDVDVEIGEADEVMLEKLLREVQGTSRSSRSATPNPCEVSEAPVAVNHHRVSKEGETLSAVEDQDRRILSLSRMRNVSEAVSQRSFSQNYGLPCCVSIGTEVIVLGTSFGYTVVFDTAQNIRCVLGSDLQEWATHPGAMTCVCVDKNDHWALCGYTGGSLVIWDLHRRCEVKSMKTAHKQPVAYAVWLEPETLFLSGDVSGHIFIHRIGTLLFRLTVKSTELNIPMDLHPLDVVPFTPRFPISTTEAVPGSTASSKNKASLLAQHHPLAPLLLVAMSTPEKYVIWSLAGGAGLLLHVGALPIDLEMRQKQRQFSNAPSVALPVMSWRPMDCCSSEVDPVLAVCFCGVVQFIRVESQQRTLRGQGFRKQDWEEDNQDFVSHSEASLLRFIPVTETSLGKEILAIHWIAERLLLCLMEDSTVVCLDFLFLEAVDHSKPISATLAFHELFGQSLHSYRFSTVGTPNGLYVLGKKDLFSCRVIHWDDRLANLVDQQRWKEALQLASDFHQNRAKGSLGLPADPRQVCTLTREKLREILHLYLDEHLSHRSLDSVASLDAISEAARTVTKYCVLIGDIEFLFGRAVVLFDKATHALSDLLTAGDYQNGGDLICDALLPYILAETSRRLPTVPLSEHDESPLERMLQFTRVHRGNTEAERIFLHLNLEEHRIEEVVRLARKHRFLSARVHILNHGKHDYINPLAELIRTVAKEATSGDRIHTKRRHETAHILVSYFKNLVNGHWFQADDTKAPVDIEPPELADAACLDSAQVLFARELRPEDSVLTAAMLEGLGDFPLLELICRIDGRHALDLIQAACLSRRVWDDDQIKQSSFQESLPRHVQDLPAMSQLLTALLTSPSTSNHGRLVPVGIPPVSDGESGSLNGRRLRRRNSILMNGGNVSPQARKSVWRMGTNKRVRFIGENTETTHSGSFSQLPVSCPLQNLRLHSPQELIQHVVHLEGLGAFLDGDALVPWSWSGASAFGDEQKLDMQQFFFQLGRLTAMGYYVPSKVMALRMFSQLSLFQGHPEEEEAENIVCSMLESFFREDWPLVRLVEIFQGCSFHRVCCRLHAIQGDYTGIITSFLSHTHPTEKVFDFLTSIVTIRDLPHSSIESVKESVIACLRRLVDVSGEGAAAAISALFAGDHARILEALHEFPRLQFRYLSGVLDTPTTHHQQEDTDGSKSGTSKSAMQKSAALYERYIDLMCQFEPGRLYTFIQANEDSFSLESVFDICNQYPVPHAISYLRERMGDSRAALEMLSQEIDKSLDTLVHFIEILVEQDDTSKPAVDQYSLELHEKVRFACDMCARSSETLPQDEVQELWFLLLDRFLTLLRELRSDHALLSMGVSFQAEQTKEQLRQYRELIGQTRLRKADFETLVKRDPKNDAAKRQWREACTLLKQLLSKEEQLRSTIVEKQQSIPKYSLPVIDVLQAVVGDQASFIMERMMGAVPLTEIVRKVVEEHSGDTFAQFRSTIMRIVETYKYELVMYRATDRCLRNDSFVLLKLDEKLRTNSLAPSEILWDQQGHQLHGDIDIGGGRKDVAALRQQQQQYQRYQQQERPRLSNARLRQEEDDAESEELKTSVISTADAVALKRSNLRLKPAKPLMSARRLRALQEQEALAKRERLEASSASVTTASSGRPSSMSVSRSSNR